MSVLPTMSHIQAHYLVNIDILPIVIHSFATNKNPPQHVVGQLHIKTLFIRRGLQVAQQRFELAWGQGVTLAVQHCDVAQL